MNLPLTDQLPLGSVGRGRYVIQRGLHEFDLKDGSVHRFHFVGIDGVRDRWLRAIKPDENDAAWVVFDLRKISPAIAVELPGYTERDVPGAIKYLLRMVWPNGRGLRRCIADQHLLVGRPAALQ